MKNIFYNLNKLYIESFINNIKKNYNKTNIHSYSGFLKNLFKELNLFFKLIGGQLSSKNLIPKKNDYPDSVQFNSLISSIHTDLTKLYSAQNLVNNDLNNIMNFNNSQRIKSYENLKSTQQNVYSLYIKNKVNSVGELIIPSNNPFTSSDNYSEQNSTVIEQNRSLLTLSYDEKIFKPVDINNTQIYFSNVSYDQTIFPNNLNLHIGCHWKIPKLEAHFVDDRDTTYKEMMIDNNSNLGIGWCEFEAIRTEIGTSDINTSSNINSSYKNDILNLKFFIGQKFNKSPDNILLDINNSLQGRFISYTKFQYPENNPYYKIVIPYTKNNYFTNEFIIDFEPDQLGYYPKINYEKSRVFSNINGSEIGFGFIKDDLISDDGVYRFIIPRGCVIPTRLELYVEYTGDYFHWIPISFYMSQYNYSVNKDYTLYNDTSEIKLILGKSFDIFVDTEVNEENEKNRALNILLGNNYV